MERGAVNVKHPVPIVAIVAIVASCQCLSTSSRPMPHALHVQGVFRGLQDTWEGGVMVSIFC